ncbi:MAG: hypothetical protein LBR61_07710 [Synergistaceae bacterium]|nr:hypothetical protein [Synergistaceae bacterium]
MELRETEGQTEGQGLFSPLNVAFFLVLYVFLPSFILSVFLLLRTGSPALAFGCSHVILLGTVFYPRRKMNGREGVLFVLLLLAAYAVSWYFFDFFTDGLAYFQPAIRRIAAGFNPLYDGYMNLGRPKDLWSEVATYYPKSMVYFAACATAALGDIQFGKAGHVLLFAAVVLYTAHATRGESAVKKCVWFAACLNPVILTQWTTTIIDGDLASLCSIGLLFANAFFTGRTLSKREYALGVMALSLLFGVKTTGFPYGSILVFFICVHCLWKAWRKKGFWNALRRTFRPGLKLGGTVLLVSCVLNFHPYITNLREGKNIFYPVIQSFHSPSPTNLDALGNDVYPDAHNRFTRLFFSVFSHPEVKSVPAKLKNPFEASVADWKPFEATYNMYAGGLGPLFGLLLVMAVLAQVFSKGRGNLWLLLTLLLLTFIQPHAWVLRYSPFVWLFPFVCLSVVPERWKLFLTVPLLVAVLNVGGILFFFWTYQWRLSRDLREMLEPYRGSVVFLDETVFQWEGIFDRFGLKRKYVNPEETVFSRVPALGHLALSRTPDGVNLFFPEDLLPLPEFPLALNQREAFPWLRMSEGLFPEEISLDGQLDVVWRSYGNKIKFFMRVDRAPERDGVLTLRGNSYSIDGVPPDLSLPVLIDNQPVGEWKITPEAGEQKFSIPRKLLEGSFEDDGHLLTLMLRIPAVSLKILPTGRIDPATFGLELEGLEFGLGAEKADDGDAGGAEEKGETSR